MTSQRGGRDQGNVRGFYWSNIFAGGADTPGNASAADRTILLDVEEYGSLSVVIDLTRIAATSLSVAAWASLDEDGTNWGRLHSEAISSGTGTLKAYTRTVAVTTDYDMVLNFPVKDYSRFKLIVTAGGTPGATDLLNAWARASVGY